MLRRSNYNIRYAPTDASPGNPLWAISVEITPEFFEFLKKQKPDKEQYEELGLRTFKALGYKNIDRKFVAEQFADSAICSWEGGLLRKIQVPGDAAGLFLEESPHLMYSTHNIASQSQTTPIMVILTMYLFDMELLIPRK